MAKEELAMYRYDSKSPTGRARFGQMTVDEWKNQMETQGFIYSPQERSLVTKAIDAVMRGEKESVNHQIVTIEENT